MGVDQPGTDRRTGVQAQIGGRRRSQPRAQSRAGRHDPQADAREIGVGQIAAGEDGLVIASDTLGDQVAVYTATDVIRLHQTAPVAASPWGVAWDAGRDLAWVASTTGNVLASYDISSGVPEQVHTLTSVADAHHIAVLPDGTLIAVSATGDGLQVIDDPAA